MLRLLLAFFFVLYHLAAWATHNRAGEIRYEQIGELTIRATIVTYTRASSVDADRDSLILMWGDGQQSTVGRSNGGGNGVNIGNDIKINLYVAEHTYSGLGNYTLSMQDPNRNAGILNVNNPNSVTVPFYIETNFTLLSAQFQGFNRSVVLLQEPIDFGCVDQIFKHDPGAFDLDGDSLAYELSVPMQAPGQEVPNYQDPDDVQPNPSIIDFDERAGTFSWVVPNRPGLYNIAFRVKEYRNGVLIASTVRDMQIFIDDCMNQAPTVMTETEFCAVVPEVVSFEVQVNDMDQGQQVRLEAQGGPFIIEDPALFLVSPGYQDPVLTGLFEWQTTCNHVRKEPYNVLFRGIDNFLDSTGLVDIQSVQIRVAAPAPEVIDAVSESEQVTVSWESPYLCDETRDDYFKGFSVWRRVGSEAYSAPPCVGGLENSGYSRIASRVMSEEAGRYVYRDQEVDPGVNYCYRVLADFALTTVNGNSFNRVSSLPSDEVCALYAQDVPVITNVSIINTDPTAGEIDIRWILPDPTVLDTLATPGPYRLELWRGSSLTPEDMEWQQVTGSIVTRSSFSELRGDTSFVDSGLNTLQSPWSYEVRFFADEQSDPYSLSAPASAPFLEVVSSDRVNILRARTSVPWDNYQYVYFGVDLSNGDTIVLDTLAVSEYRDEDLENGQEYCYMVRTLGTYGVPDWKDPLRNWSQIACGTPLDTVPPCVPSLSISNTCDDPSPSPEGEVFNETSWSLDLGVDCDYQDLEAIRIYFTAIQGREPQVLATVNPQSQSYRHVLEDNLSGCYAVSSIDVNGNESELSEFVCVNNCPSYSLPNVFTPNGDGANDLFSPFPYRFVERIELKVYNRWGQLVYETTDPDILWDGTNFQGEDLAEGVYSYKLVVYERAVTGITAQEPVGGFIHLIR